MKTEMHVVSSYEISPSCTAKGGFIRVGEKSSKNHRKNVYTMDEAITKLKKVLREMKNQDKDIYRQLMALNSNIKRLKNEIAGEEEKRQQNDIDLEYDCDSVDTCSDDDSCSDFEINDLEMNDIKCKEDSNQSSGIESAELKDADSDSIHERFDSGIQEDASYNPSPYSSVTPPLSKPKRRGTSWNGERSALYNFLLTNLPASDDSQESSDIDEEHTSKMAPKVWDKSPEKQDSGADSGLSKGADGSILGNANRIQPRNLPEDVLGDKEQDNPVGGASNEVKSKNEDSIKQGEGSKLQRSQTPQPRTVAKLHGRRRTMSEDQMKVDANGNYITQVYSPNTTVITKDACRKSSLGYISENDGKGTWNAFDARNYRDSERLVRRDILPIRGIRINQQLIMPESYDKQLNRSLTQLNIDGAISNSAIKAIQRPSSNCEVFTDSTIVNDNLTKSWNISRKMAYEMPPKGRARIRLQRTTSAYMSSREGGFIQQIDLEAGCLKQSSEQYSSTISLV